MSTESIVLWICQREADCPLVYAIPVALFGDSLPKLEAFVTAVTQPPRDDDATELPSDSSGSEEEEGEEAKNERAASPKRAKIDPAAKAFRNHVDAAEFMVKRLAELGVPVRTGTWSNVWEQPTKVVLSVDFEI
jgi:hypothetical protein